MSLYLTNTQRERLLALCDECRALGATSDQLSPILKVASIRAPDTITVPPDSEFPISFD